MSEHPDSHAAKSDAKPPRSLPLDALRGLVMVWMALDHANLLVAQQHSSGEYWGGPFPHHQTVLSFVTRFVTHFSAPGFFFLMGVGMVLFANARRKQGWSEWAVIGHFVLRGAILIALQFLIVNQAWALSPGGWGIEIYIGVLVALGGTMILGSLLLRLEPMALLVLTLFLALGGEWLMPHPDAWNEPVSVLGRILLLPGGDQHLWANYSILPWLKLVTFGLLFGRWMVEDAQKAFARALKVGLALLAAFVVIRAADGFGNIRPRAGDTWIDFLNPVKYPPSLAFTLLTTGVNLTMVGLFARLGEKAQRYLQPLAVFGRAPLLFYLLHLFLYAGLGHWLTSHGTSIPEMYPYWLLGLASLYPLCLWYGRFKRRQPAHSVLRFF